MQKTTTRLLMVIGVLVGVVIFLVYYQKGLGGGPDSGVNTPVSQGSGQLSSATIQPEDPNEAGLAPYPDLSVGSLPQEPIPVKYVVEHRSALNGSMVKVSGYVISTLLGEKACPPGRGMCTQPSVFLADSTEDTRDPLYDLRVLVNDKEQERDYQIGNQVVIPVIVDGSKVAVIGRKAY